MDGRYGGTHGLKIALVAYIAIFMLLLAAYFMTNILVMLAQALEVVSDVLISAFLLLSIYWSRKPADEFHMFGHGRAQNVAGLVSATIFIFFMSLEVFREAIPKFFEPEASELKNAGLALTVIAVSMLILAIPLVDMLRVKMKGPSVRAEMVQIIKDEISYVPALVGVYLVGQGFYLADPITSMIIGAVIVIGGLYLFQDNVHYLLGRAPSKEFMRKVRSVAKSVSGVLGVHDLRAEYVGPNLVHTGFHIEVAKGTPIERQTGYRRRFKKKSVRRQAANTA